MKGILHLGSVEQDCTCKEKRVLSTGHCLVTRCYLLKTNISQVLVTAVSLSQTAKNKASRTVFGPGREKHLHSIRIFAVP